MYAYHMYLHVHIHVHACITVWLLFIRDKKVIAFIENEV